MMKGTQTQVICPSPFQFDKSADHVENVKPGKNLLYGVLRNQENKYKRVATAGKCFSHSAETGAGGLTR